MFLSPAQHYAKPALVKAVPTEYHKWIDPCIKMGCQGVGVSMAWLLQRVMSALHCSMRGAFIVVSQSQKAAVRMGYMSKVVVAEDSAAFSLLVTFLAAIGFLNQVASGFSLPLPLQILFAPIYLVEFSLTQTIGQV